MQDNDNKDNAVTQAESIIQDALRRNDYLALYNFAERVVVSLQAMKGYQRKGLHNLTGINVNALLIEGSELLQRAESPYESDDLDDTEPPEESVI